MRPNDIADAPRRWAWAEIDLDALARNVAFMRDRVAPSAVWAIVKANGYGHGAVAVAQRALEAGAQGLGVAFVDEAIALRHAGITAQILVLSEQPVDRVDDIIRHRLTPMVYTMEFAEALAAGGAHDLPIHIMVDTGMQRVGADQHHVGALAARLVELAPHLRVEGVCTHLACADSVDLASATGQIEQFDRVLHNLEGTLRPELVHIANSAAALAIDGSHRSLVRAGIALYGISPGVGVEHLAVGLRPVMSLRANISFVKQVAAGSHVSYGWRHQFATDTTLATLPLGYADGVPRGLGTMPDRQGADVLIGGRRCPIVGVVTMDQLMVDVGGLEVEVGDEAVLIGQQGDEIIRVEEWADRMETIGYEIVCGISQRMPRVIMGQTRPDAT